MKLNNPLKIILLCILITVAILIIINRGKIEIIIDQKTIAQIPEESFQSDAGFFSTISPTKTQTLSRKELFLQNLPNELPEEKLLAVPFICQNPFMDEKHWQLHDNSCEEAAILQSILYLKQDNYNLTPQQAHEYILEMIAWQKQTKHFSKHRDIYNEDLTYFTKNFFKFDDDEVFFLENADTQLIKKIIAFGLPVVVPTMAHDLQNPFYHHPNYHMLTVIGYTKDKAITNDVGTKRGEKFAYKWSTLMKANANAKGGILIICPNNTAITP